MAKKVVKSKSVKKKPVKRTPTTITLTGGKGIGKPNNVVDESTKRTPLDPIPVQKGTGKTFKAREKKKPRLLNNLPEPTRKAILMTGGILIGSLMVRLLFDMVLKNDAEDHEKAKNEVFDVVSNNCSSLGVNKMAIVDKTSKMIRSERLKRKSADKRVEQLEKFILNYNSVSKEEMEDMLQENEILQTGIKNNTPKNRKKLVEISNLKREVQAFIPRFNMD